MSTEKFREERYKAAIETHRHYDNLSIAVCAGQFAITYGCFYIHAVSTKVIYTTPIFLLGAIAVGMLYLLYFLLSKYAGYARDVAEKIETSKEFDLGVSIYINVTRGVDLQILLNSKNRIASLIMAIIPKIRFSIKFLIFIISIGEISVLVVAGFLVNHIKY